MTCLAEWRCAGRTRRREFDREEDGVRWEFQYSNDFLYREDRSAIVERSSRVMLHPLAEVGVGVLVPVVISGRQLVMDILRHSERGNGEQEEA
jgi:hypothetical protein